MQVEICTTTYSKVDLDTEECVRVTKETISDICGIPSRPSIDEDGNLVATWEVGGGCHSWDDDKIMRKATDLDKAALLVLDKIRMVRY